MSDSTVERPIVEAEPARPVDEAPPSRADRARDTAFRSRFAAVYLVLAIVAGAAIGAFVVLLARPDAGPPAKWSSFEPTGDVSERLYQIVNNIPKHYRGEDGTQLVSAAVDTPQTSIVDNGQNVVLRVARITVEEAGSQTPIATNNSLQFTLCGSGQGCAVAGKPSEERFALLQREALELALYAFRYVDDVDNVTLLMPPTQPAVTTGSSSAQQQQTAIFLQRKDVLPHLERPLAATLAGTAPTIGAIPPRELDVLKTTTRPNVFAYGYRQTQDGAVELVLAPPGSGQ